MRDLSRRLPVRLLGFVRKAALIPLLLPLLLFMGAKFYLHAEALSVVEQAIARLPHEVQFGFERIDSHFDGAIDIQGATLLLEGMSLPLQFQTLRLTSGNWRELPLMAEGLELGVLPDAVRLDFTLSEAELENLAAASLLPVDGIRMLLGCFQPVESTVARGAESAALFSGALESHFDRRSEYLSLKLQLDAELRYRLELNADLDLGGADLSLASLGTAGLGGAQLSYLNRGAQTDLLRRCGATGRSGLVEGSYVSRQSLVVKHRLLQQGWSASTELELAYQDYLFLPQLLRLEISAPQAVSLDRLSWAAPGWGQFRVRLELNSAKGLGQNLQWSAAAHQLAATPVVPSVAPSVEPPTIAEVQFQAPERVAEPPLTDNQLQERLSETLSYQPAYKTVSIAELSGLLGAPLKLVTVNGRRMEGVLDSLESDRLQLRREISQGIAVFPVRLDIIRGMQAYF